MHVGLNTNFNFATELNLLGKDAHQQSTFASFKANSPINGRIGPNKCADRGFSRTKDENNPWWQVNLGGYYKVEKVKVMTRCKMAFFTNFFKDFLQMYNNIQPTFLLGLFLPELGPSVLLIIFLLILI